MNDIKLHPIPVSGVYQLQEPIDNPKPDGRRANNWCFTPVVERGLFDVFVEPLRFDDDDSGHLVEIHRGAYHTGFVVHSDGTLARRTRERSELRYRMAQGFATGAFVRLTDLASQLHIAERFYGVSSRKLAEHLVTHGNVAEKTILYAIHDLCHPKDPP